MFWKRKGDTVNPPWTRLETECAEAKAEAQSLRNQLTIAASENQALSAAKNYANKQTEEARAAASQLHDRVDSLENELARANRLLREERASNRMDVGSLRSQNSKLQHRVVALEEEQSRLLGSIRHETEQRKAAAAKEKARIDNLQKEVNRLKAQNAFLREDLASSTERLVDAQRKLNPPSAFSEVSIDDLEASVRTYNCLKNSEIRTINELVAKTSGELLRTKNFGRKSLNELRGILLSRGLFLMGERPVDMALVQPVKEGGGDEDYPAVIQ